MQRDQEESTSAYFQRVLKDLENREMEKYRLVMLSYETNMIEIVVISEEERIWIIKRYSDVIVYVDTDPYDEDDDTSM